MFKKVNGHKLDRYIKEGKKLSKIPKSTRIKAPKATKSEIPNYDFGGGYTKIMDTPKPFTNVWY